VFDNFKGNPFPDPQSRGTGKEPTHGLGHVRIGYKDNQVFNI
jgi:hypothetical protein